MKYSLSLAFILCSLAGFAQAEYDYFKEPDYSKIAYGPGFRFKPGIYRSYDNFINNSPAIPVDWIVSGKDKQDRSFFAKIFRDDVVEYDSSGHRKNAIVNEIWGFSDGRTVYVMNRNFASGWDRYWSKNPFATTTWTNEGGWSRIDIIGSVCVLIVIKEYTGSYNNGLINSDMYGSSRQSTMGYSEAKRYMFEVKTGNLKELTLNNMMEVCQRAPAFYKSCNPPSNGKEQKTLYYLMEYNRKHPIYFPE